MTYSPERVALGTAVRWSDEGRRRFYEGLKARASTNVPGERRARRFWANVDKSSGPDACWEWVRSRNPRGYGNVNFGGRTLKAHRVAWELTNVAIPDGMLVLHHCDNPPCCNPAHLFLGTKADNAHDRDAKGRAATGDRCGSRTHPERRPRGEAQHAAKLTAEIVRQMRRLRAEHGLYYHEIAAAFGVGASTARHAITGLYWKHVQ